MTLITREFPDSTNDFLHFQIGFIETRPMLRPVYDNTRAKGLRLEECGRMTSVFHILGFGATLQAAQKMVDKKLKKKENLK